MASAPLRANGGVMVFESFVVCPLSRAICREREIAEHNERSAYLRRAQRVMRTNGPGYGRRDEKTNKKKIYITIMKMKETRKRTRRRRVKNERGRPSRGQSGILVRGTTLFLSGDRCVPRGFGRRSV